MNILNIDTSCDETSIAITNGSKVISNVIFSQVKYHAPFGGVYPTIAKREHLSKIQPALQVALKRAHLDIKEIEAFAVTYGPGLAPALEVGVNFAKQLASKNHKPLIPVNHLESHIYSAFVQNSKGHPNREIKYPFMSLIASGGHTELVYLKAPLEYQIIGSTLDDAVGEALDKAGKMLGLGYPGGPVIERLSMEGIVQKDLLPIPMQKSNDLNFSYSGLKTAFKRLLDNLTEKEKQQKLKNLCATFQESAFLHLTNKLEKALEKFPVSILTIGGGVSANKYLNRQIKKIAKKYKVKVFFPPYQYLSGDNAAMLGIVADIKYHQGKYLKTASEIETLDRLPRASL